MKLFKMTIVDSKDFEHAFSSCQQAYGFIAQRKRTLVWIVTFETGDYEVIRECLEETGSVYRGIWHM